MSIQPNEQGGKRIEVCEIAAKDIRVGFGNPRKIRGKELQKLKQSIETFGDFGIFVVDEHNNVIAGNQRLSVIMDIDPTTMLTCKRLIGYSEAELRAINIKANTHSGEWDLDMLSQWTADLNVDLGISVKDVAPEKRKIPDMEPIRYEKYDYVMIVCRNEIDYLNLTRALGISEAKVLMVKKRRIKARAVWFDDIKAQIVPKSTVPEAVQQEPMPDVSFSQDENEQVEVDNP